MKRIKYFLLSLLIIVIHDSLRSQNPILPIGTYVADPSAKVWDDGRLYIYGSKDESTKHWCSYEYFVVSTTNMIEWRIEKDAFYSKGDNDQVPYNNQLLFAPDCQFFDGKYYLYYSQPNPNSPEGVAVSNRSVGPFKSGKPIDLNGYNQIDPSVFVDDDGQAYYLWGQFTMKMAKLNSDHISLKKETIRDSILTESEHYFHEGAFLTKQNGIYYLVYTDISRANMPTCIGYATSKSIFGPYKYGGVIIDNDHCDPAVWNNHGSIAKFKNQWYVFYHRSSHGSSKMRRSCVEPIFFNADGSISEVEMTSQGAGLPLNAFNDIEAERACLLHGKVHLQGWNPNNEELANINNTDRAAYKYIDFGKGEAKKVDFVVKPGFSAGKIKVNLSKPWQQTIAIVEVPANTGADDWITVSAELTEVSGIHEVWLTFQGKGDNLFSIDKFIFKK